MNCVVNGKSESMDIVELLYDYVNLLEKSGIPRSSMESRIMLEAADVIENLRNVIGFAAVDQEGSDGLEKENHRNH